MNVVIVDDDPKGAEKINSVVEGYMEARKLDCMIDVYTDPEAFWGKWMNESLMICFFWIFLWGRWMAVCFVRKFWQNIFTQFVFL